MNVKDKLPKLHRYIAYIRNDAKRHYAENYAQHVLHGWQLSESAHPCSYMAKQAVRLNIHEILGL